MLKPAWKSAEFWLTAAVLLAGIIGVAWLIHRGLATHAVALAPAVAAVHATGRISRAWLKRADLKANPIGQLMTLSQIVKAVEDPAVRARIKANVPRILDGARALVDSIEALHGAMTSSPPVEVSAKAQ